MRNRRTAVLGGSGFIGRYVVKRLAAQGEVVTVGCRHAEEAKFLQPMGNVGQIAVVNLSIGDDTLLPAFLAGNDALVNCVGTLYERGGQTFDLVHHLGPARLARLAREAGIEHFVHLSALGADLRSTSAYARSKAAGEQAVHDAFATASILRPSVVFGPEDQFFNRLAAMAMVAPALPLIGGGHTRFQPVYVGDVAEAVIRCLSDPVAAGRTYELGGPKVYSFRELVEVLLHEIGRRRLLIDLPFGLAELQARLLSLLPTPPLTPDQVELLKRDNVVSAGAMTFESLGITPTALEVILPTYLDRFRRGGWYDRPRA
ncbi:MAG TPA: complex I NDUFA9 subunit family protein [Stellaceae bacterium]|nr:complex I NDUFA9 subunit family protein [Stellaceae bacterium]